MHQETFELNCSRTSLAMDGTLVVVVEMSLSTWLVCAEVPGLERRAMMKMSVDETELLSQLHRWRDEAEKRADCRVSRICVAYEAGRDGFWLARWLRGNGIEAHVMHSTSIPVKRDHRRAKTDRLDCQLMMRAFPGWLRREEGHCRMVAVPTAEQEDARRVTRERKGLVREQTKLINRLKAMFACLGIRNFKPHLKKAPERLDGLLTPEGDPIPANTLAEIRRAMNRLVLGPNYAKVPNPPQDFRYPIETAYISSIWCPPIYGDDFGLLFWGKNADRILKLLVREIELSEHVETAPRLR